MLLPLNSAWTHRLSLRFCLPIVKPLYATVAAQGGTRATQYHEIAAGNIHAKEKAVLVVRKEEISTMSKRDE